MDWLGILTSTVQQLFAPTTLAFALAAVGLAVHFGFTGLLNMGMAGFMAVGAYGYALTTLHLDAPWWVGMLVGVLASVGFAFILGLPTLRLRADYLAIVTIGAAEIVRLVLTSTAFQHITGGSNGPKDPPNASFNAANPFPPGTYGFGPFTYTAAQIWYITFAAAVLAAALVFVWLLMRSPWGRALKGIREDEDAVRALGKNVFAYKMQALVIGGVFGGLGGIVYALPSTVVPGNYVTSLTFFLWTALLLGGAATIFGPVLGSMIYWAVITLLSNLLPALSKLGILPLDTTQSASLRYILVGVALMLIVIYRPQGILGNKKELTFVK